MSGLETIVLAALVGGTALKAVSQIGAGHQAEEMAKLEQQRLQYEAEQLEIKGREEMAASQQEAKQLRRKKELAQSTVQAKSAASGFSATDGNTMDIIAGIEEQGEMQAQMAMFGGESRRAGMDAQAEGRRYTGRLVREEGAQKKRAGYVNAFGTILSGAASAGKFGMSPGGSGSSYSGPMTGAYS